MMHVTIKQCFMQSHLELWIQILIPVIVVPWAMQSNCSRSESVKACILPENGTILKKPIQKHLDCNSVNELALLSTQPIEDTCIITCNSYKQNRDGSVDDEHGLNNCCFRKIYTQCFPKYAVFFVMGAVTSSRERR